MSTRIFSSRDFTRDVAAAKAAALTGPVLIPELTDDVSEIPRVDIEFRDVEL